MEGDGMPHCKSSTFLPGDSFTLNTHPLLLQKLLLITFGCCIMSPCLVMAGDAPPKPHGEYWEPPKLVKADVVDAVVDSQGQIWIWQTDEEKVPKKTSHKLPPRMKVVTQKPEELKKPKTPVRERQLNSKIIAETTLSNYRKRRSKNVHALLVKNEKKKYTIRSPGGTNYECFAIGCELDGIAWANRIQDYWIDENRTLWLVVSSMVWRLSPKHKFKAMRNEKNTGNILQRSSERRIFFGDVRIPGENNTYASKRLDARRVLGKDSQGRLLVVGIYYPLGLYLDLGKRAPKGKHPTSAIWALRKIGSHSKSLLPVFIKELQDESVFIRREAAEKLGLMGSAAVEAIPLLLKGLKDEGGVQALCGKALGAMGKKGKVAIPALEKLLHDKNKFVRRSAADALKNIRQSDLNRRHN